MPLVALNRVTKERIVICDYDNPKAGLSSIELECPFCHEGLILCQGFVRTPYFRHRVACPNTEFGSHPESQNHLQGKADLAARLKREYANQGCDPLIELEVLVREVRRIADILVTFPMGWRVAHEIQLAAITTETLQRRSDDYLKAGIDVVWWLGNNANTETNRRYCSDRFGEINIIGFKESTTNPVIVRVQ